ncbi:hypothetical protein AAFF_G00359660 [Aldrovandia affinis]|uniref:Uncharacterized protein n=1 Tax=Aldrovandia affinis TaxID=143900 RepID=A0AAD7WNC9_9TELE|nr:hypothetical protein AAFF_G00359660 [Aldrovandia affinis]
MCPFWAHLRRPAGPGTLSLEELPRLAWTDVCEARPGPRPVQPRSLAHSTAISPPRATRSECLEDVARVHLSGSVFDAGALFMNVLKIYEP